MRNLGLVEIKKISIKEVDLQFKTFKVFRIEVVEDSMNRRFVKIHFKYSDESKMQHLAHVVITRYVSNAKTAEEYYEILEDHRNSREMYGGQVEPEDLTEEITRL